MKCVEAGGWRVDGMRGWKSELAERGPGIVEGGVVRRTYSRKKARRECRTEGEVTEGGRVRYLSIYR